MWMSCQYRTLPRSLVTPQSTVCLHRITDQLHGGADIVKHILKHTSTASCQMMYRPGRFVNV